MYVTGHFDGGRIGVAGTAADGAALLRVQKDDKADFRQWFSFRCVTEPGRMHELRFINAGECNRPEGWQGFRALASYDHETWFRVPTTFDGEQAVIRHAPEHPIIHYAAFAPYSLERHADRLTRWVMRPGVQAEVIGESVDGRPIDLLTIGEATPARRRCWIVARQHPSETMAQWCVEGLIDRLLDGRDEAARLVREGAVIHVVPNANPDGSVRGYTRTNAAGVDLNRAWAEPSERHSPEVLAIRRHMQRTGVDFFLDLHGEESIPYVFIVNADAVPGATPSMVRNRGTYEAALMRENKWVQTEHGYRYDPPGEADLSIGSNYVAQTFGCLSMTLEQPFKDVAERPVDDEGWSPRRCRELGAANVGALAEVLGVLR